MCSTDRRTTAAAGQIFGVPTYDSLFKYILEDAEVRASFLRAFITGSKIKSSTRISEFMKPVKEFELLRHFLHDEKNVAIAQQIASAPDLQFLFPASSSSSSPQSTKSMKFLKSLAGHFGDLQKALPSAS